MQGEFGKKTYSIYNKVSRVTHALKLSSKEYLITTEFGLSIYYFIPYFEVFLCQPNQGQNLKN